MTPVRGAGGSPASARACRQTSSLALLWWSLPEFSPRFFGDKAHGAKIPCYQCGSKGKLGACQRLQQRPGLLQVGGVKALGEPAIDRCQQVVSLGALTLLLPQATQAHRRPQLQRLRLLAAGNLQGLLITGFCLLLMGCQLLEQQLSLEPIHLCLIDTVIRGL